MKAKTCLEAFAKGKADSQKYPRTQGAYKLSEVLDRSKRREKEVSRIAKALKDPSSRYDLMHCTYEDMHVWLLDILEHVAYELSATVIPSFKALTGDGMTQSQIDQHLPYVERRCKVVLKELERARQSIKGRIHDEYDRMRQGKSVVGDALTHAREMLEEIIDLTPPDIQRQIYGPVEEVI
jgi:hypothetical protein